MKTNTPVNEAVSLSMMIALGVMMANGAVAESQSKKDCSRRERDRDLDSGCSRSTQHNAATVKRVQN